MNKASCICEFPNGERGRNGIMCYKNGTFARSYSCSDDEFCTGPTSKENAVAIDGARSLLCSGMFWLGW